MRVGLIRLKYDLSGGAEKSLLLLARGLAARGHRVWVICRSWQGEAPAGVTVHQVGLNRLGLAPRPVRFARAVEQAMAQLNLDTYLSLDRAPGAPIFRAGDGCHASWLKRRQAHEPAWKGWSFAVNPKHRAILALEKRMLSHPGLKTVIANSRLVARELADFYRVPESKLAVIRNGVDEEALLPWRGGETREKALAELGLAGPVSLFLGSGFERKGLAFAIEALPGVPDTTLLVAGRGKTGRFARQAATLGVSGRVVFLGVRDDAPRLLAAANALILPTIYDPCSNACLEALYLGRPVVTTEANGAAELLEDGWDGAVVADPSDREALALAWSRALAMSPRPGDKVCGLAQWLEATMEILEHSL